MLGKDMIELAFWKFTVESVEGDEMGIVFFFIFIHFIMVILMVWRVCEKGESDGWMNG
jgi:hypothetical protein